MYSIFKMLALNVSTTTAPEVTAPPGGYFEAVTEATAPNSGYYEAVTEVTTPPGGYFEAVTEATAPNSGYYEAVTEVTTPPGGYYEAVTEVTTPPGGYYEAVTEVTVLPGGYYEAITEVIRDTLNSSSNSSSSNAQLETQREFYAAILPTLIVFTLATTLVSSVVVCATPWVKRPISPTVRLSLSLAAANTLFAITWTLCLVGNMYLPMVKKVEVPECLKLSLEVMRLCSILIQILHLLVVALNHYIGIIRPLHYAATFTPTTLKAILAILWLTPLVGMFVVFSSVSQEGFQSTGCSRVTFYTQGLTFRVVWTCIFFGPTVVIIIVYCHIFHLLNNRSLYLVCPEQRSHLRRNIKTVRTTALIVGTFVVGWGPAVVKFVLICGECVFQEMDLHTQMYLGAGFNTLFSLKVFIDTFIYAIRLPDIRKALLTMWVIFRDRLKTRDPGLVDTSAVSSSRTGSTRLSYSSPSIHRLLHDLRASVNWKPLRRRDYTVPQESSSSGSMKAAQQVSRAAPKAGCPLLQPLPVTSLSPEVQILSLPHHELASAASDSMLQPRLN
ncbi:uncharacterized protein [Procambarus clarkii]|uniref:uncharacterized protein n=1 Tax=Procambarus clarkii TaxID=6728 RepID=UPI0037420407